MESTWKWKLDLKVNYSTIVIPAYNEGANINRTIQDLSRLYGSAIDVTIVVDFEEDTTIDFFNRLDATPNTFKIVVQNYGPGPANAIRYGIDHANTECVVILMADGSDDVRAIQELSNLVSRGVAVACASRYMSGGQQIGGPRFKKFLSKTAGKILYSVAGVGTHDPTNSFKAYSREMLQQVCIESRSGFEIGIELVSKAHRLRLPVAEIPTIWLDRTDGSSRFLLAKWAPKYLPWFFNCFAPKASKTQR
jgi:glycosyltransferase involved in cell wall biosynthesis